MGGFCSVILSVFLDSWMFVLSSTILQASFGLNSSPRACDAGILLCLVCYLSSKVLMYFFLVEKVIPIAFLWSLRISWADFFNRYILFAGTETLVGKINYFSSICLE